jgi:hypothetical protein
VLDTQSLEVSCRSALLLLLVTVPATEAEAQPTRAALLTSVSPAHCVAALERREAVDPLRCPSALRTAIAEAQATCHDAGGTLAGADEGDVWAIDVNADGRSELAFALDGNVTCTGAWSLFSCGSLGCPKVLYELRDSAWANVGSLSASSPEQVALGSARAADGHHTLEVCRQNGCAERWFYDWRGRSYEVARAEIRGARVDVAGSVHGLHPLAAATAVRATPRASGTEVGRYDADTDVAIIGTAEGGDWYYVSPCNACESGFVPRSSVSLR